MKAIRVRAFGGPEQLLLEDVPDLRPGPKQVVVRIRAIGVNPVETYIRAGTYPLKPALPYTPGTDAAGTVESVGGEVKSFRPGDRVYFGGSLTGAYAEAALCEEEQVHPFPAHLSFPQGAAINVPYVTASRALFSRGHARGAETVLINGASGGVGIAAVQLARAAGLRVIGTAGTERGTQLVLSEGAHECLDHRAPDHFEKALALTGGKGFELIIEMLANVNLAKDLTILARFGRAVVVGNRGTIEINPRETMGRDATILGMSLANASPDELSGIHATLYAGFENKTLRPVINKELPLAEAPRAHADVLSAGAYGKIVLIP